MKPDLAKEAAGTIHDRRPTALYHPSRRLRSFSFGIVTAIRACGLAGSSVVKGMKKISYKGYRFPPEIIHQAIWLYFRFTLSFRDVEDL